ncbi:hypothetical protein AK812_SmicGene6369 [Symbiodinium microadriaticum]|uniref:Uncharacterized protein n=1 Tax=Symbiodinium microadriaticum TaxID=2951 RepID=A0A1Q9ERA7_SYMMI|nr:hypothetical protein AK812_SmicGene6369 [Symbiodinium microadriaticum]
MHTFALQDIGQVRWSHDAVYDHFKDGTSVFETVVELLNGKLKLQDLPPLQLVKKGGQYYSLSNRRLYAIRQYAQILKKFGHLHEKTSLSVPVSFAEGFSGEAFTSVTGGLRVDLIRPLQGPSFPLRNVGPSRPPSARSLSRDALSHSKERNRSLSRGRWVEPDPQGRRRISFGQTDWRFILTECDEPSVVSYPTLPICKRTKTETEVGELVLMCLGLQRAVPKPRQAVPRPEIRDLLAKLAPGGEDSKVQSWLGGSGYSLGHQSYYEKLLPSLRQLVERLNTQLADTERVGCQQWEDSADFNGCTEGKAFELGRMDRIVCGVVTAEGRHTRKITPAQYRGRFLVKKHALNFLGVEISVEGDKIVMQQRRWILQELNRRGWVRLKGSQSLPQLEMAPDEARDELHAKNLATARLEIGALMWIGILRSRPDILAAVSMGARVMQRRPAEICQFSVGLWRYVRGTLDVCLQNGPDGNPTEMTFPSDASFDLVQPGWAVARTLVPLRHVDAQVDRTDHRMLRLTLRLAKGASCPGEARTSCFLLTLSFEDNQRRLFAENHLRKYRKAVREHLSANVEKFVDARLDGVRHAQARTSQQLTAALLRRRAVSRASASERWTDEESRASASPWPGSTRRSPTPQRFSRRTTPTPTPGPRVGSPRSATPSPVPSRPLSRLQAVPAVFPFPEPIPHSIPDRRTPSVYSRPVKPSRSEAASMLTTV